VRGAIKWVVLGGAAIGGTVVAGPAGALIPLPSVPIVRAFDP
jgi:hypothetical protein